MSKLAMCMSIMIGALAAMQGEEPAHVAAEEVVTRNHGRSVNSRVQPFSVDARPIRLATNTRPRKPRRQIISTRRTNKSLKSRRARPKAVQQNSGQATYNNTGWGCRTCGYRNGTQLSGTRDLVSFPAQFIALPNGDQLDLR